VPAQLVSHYRVLGQIGRGGMGVVYRAEDTSLRRTVALKFLPEHLANDVAVSERLRQEARLASALNHPNICTVYEVGEDSGEVFIAMEYVEGRPLSEVIASGELPLDSTLRYGRQLASALAHAHDRGVVHGDLKPSNIIITPEGDAKILDFGLARRSDPAQFDRQTLETISAESRPGLGGTLPYMAPEQIDGRPASESTDLWSLGVVLYEMAAGFRPFNGENLYLLCSSILHDSPKALPPKVPAGIGAVIMRSLEKEPERRYQRGSEVRAALEPLTPSREEVVMAAPTPSPRVLWLRIAAAILLLLFVFGAYRFRGRVGNAGSSGTVPHPVVLGILPPARTVDSAESAFNEGLADTLNSRLGELSAHHPFAVIPMTEIVGKGVATADAARREFGVNLALLLNVQRAGDTIRVNYSLVDTRSHHQVRGGTVTSAAGDPFALQDRVFESVASDVELQLAPDELQAARSQGTAEPAAFDYYMQGRGYLQDYVVPEKVDSAVRLFERALEKDPSYAAATASLGEAYWRKYQLSHDPAWAKAAIQTCEKAAEQGPRLAAAHACLGQAYMAQGEYAKAADQYRRTLEVEPTSDDAYGGLASAYEKLNQLSEAEASFKRAIALRPGYWATYNWLGLFYMDHARYAEAVEMFSQVVTLAPDSFTGYYNLGAVRILQGKYAEAVPLLEKSLSIRPTGAANSNLALAYFQMRRYEDSAMQFEKAVALDPNEYLLWGNLGDAYYWSAGKSAKAADAYARAISLGEEKLRLNPRDAQLLSSLGMYHAMRGEKKAALENLDASLRLQPKAPDLVFNAGIVYEQLGDTQHALSSLEKAVSLGFSPDLIRDTPNFDSLRDNPRYVSLLENHQNK
jgi:tetratricopeptide (TPR) repeat protein/predicted Ser/Thr protein kinase